MRKVKYKIEEKFRPYPALGPISMEYIRFWIIDEDTEAAFCHENKTKTIKLPEKEEIIPSQGDFEYISGRKTRPNAYSGYYWLAMLKVLGIELIEAEGSLPAIFKIEN
jgi:hypothetical protein